MHGEITTTLAKAKFLKSHAEKIITKANKTKLASRRAAVSALTGGSIKKLFEEIAPGFSARQGGYTRIIKLSPRTGDNAPMAKIQLVSLDKSKFLNSKTSKKTKRVESVVKNTKKVKTKDEKIKKAIKTKTKTKIKK